MAIKLYLDEDITAAPHLAATLRRRGFDVVSTIEVGNRQLDDREQFAYAIAEQRVLFTFRIIFRWRKYFRPFQHLNYPAGVRHLPGRGHTVLV